jgi:Protein of unknown function (DUF3025)
VRDDSFAIADVPHRAPYFAQYAAMLERFGPMRSNPQWIAEFNAQSAPQVVLKASEQPLKALDYEREIHTCGAIPTRLNSWHDLMNAMVWAQFPHAKRALNARHMDEANDGAVKRSRVRDGLTLLDESGIVICARDPSLFAAHQKRDWATLLVAHRSAWQEGAITATLFGHGLMAAMIEQPHAGLTAKAIWFDEGLPAAQIDAALAQRIAQADAAFPAQLLPLPVFGIPGWCAANASPAFYENARVFRPLPTIRI